MGNLSSGLIDKQEPAVKCPGVGKRVRAKGTCRSPKAALGTIKDGQYDWDVVAEEGGGRSYNQARGRSPDPVQPFRTLRGV